MDERRIPSGKRSHRVVAGGISFPVSIIVGSVIHKLWGDSMGQEFTLAVAGIAGSLCTLISICFWDLRGLALEQLRKRRLGDGKQ